MRIRTRVVGLLAASSLVATVPAITLPAAAATKHHCKKGQKYSVKKHKCVKKTSTGGFY
jgi:hypothetical protein